MMIIACDTTGAAVSAALWQNGCLLAETTLKSAQPHSVTLLPLIEDLCRRCGVAVQDADALACAIGPGSYTGIRIGVSAMKAMAFAAGKPAIGISTLAAMAWPYAACPDLIICPMLDARNQRIYASAWRDGAEIIAPANILAADFVETLRLYKSSVLLVGHQPEAFFQSCGIPVLDGTQIAPAVAALPRAAAIAELAEIQLELGNPGLPQLLMPQYLSLSQAERRKAEQHV